MLPKSAAQDAKISPYTAFTTHDFAFIRPSNTLIVNESCMNLVNLSFQDTRPNRFSPTRFNTSKSLFISVRLTSVIIILRVHISVAHDFFSSCSRTAHVSQPYSKHTWHLIFIRSVLARVGRVFFCFFIAGLTTRS